MPNRPSTTERFLKGRQIPGHRVLTGLVTSVRVRKDGARVVTDDAGNSVVLSKARLMEAFNRSLSAVQKKAMMRTIRQTANHRATMMLGGKKKGVRKTYVNVAAAKRALARRYGK